MNIDQQLKNARIHFMMYSMKVTYGYIEDRIYNTEQANYWNKIYSKLKNK